MKTNGIYVEDSETLSPPSRRRGLKIITAMSTSHLDKVASFAEAWIEKCVRQARVISAQRSPPSRRRGLKTPKPEPEEPEPGRLLRGGVD